MERLVIELEEKTGAISWSLPQNKVVALGMLEVVREAILILDVRTKLVPHILPVSGVLPKQ